jgi:hypothetical protein
MEPLLGQQDWSQIDQLSFPWIRQSALVPLQGPTPSESDLRLLCH